MNHPGRPFPPQAFIFRTVQNRSLEIVAVLVASSLLTLGSVWDVARLVSWGLLGPLVFAFLHKDRASRWLWFLQNLPYGVMLYLVLPASFPLPLGGGLSLALGALLLWRPRLPALALVVSLAILAWPAPFRAVDSPLGRYYQKLQEGAVGDSIGMAGLTPSDEDRVLTDRLNNILVQMGANMPVGYIDVLTGKSSEYPADRAWPLLILGFFYLWARGHLASIAVLGFTISFFPLYLFLGGLPLGKNMLESDALFLFANGIFMVPLLWHLSDYRMLPLGVRSRLFLGVFMGVVLFLASVGNLVTAVFGSALLFWLTQRIFERASVDEAYLRGDSLLLLFLRDRP